MADTFFNQLPLIASNQAQKHITHNEALVKVDALIQLAVISQTRTTPPGSPLEGDRYIIASGATGAWAGKDLNIAVWTSGAWAFYAPPPGLGVLCRCDRQPLGLQRERLGRGRRRRGRWRH